MHASGSEILINYLVFSLMLIKIQAGSQYVSFISDEKYVYVLYILIYFQINYILKYIKFIYSYLETAAYVHLLFILGNA